MNDKRPNKSQSYRFTSTFFVASILVLVVVALGQQCAKIDLSEYEEVNFLSVSANPFRLDPPVDYPQHRRIVFLIDMSHSTVSGPCPQDIEEDIVDWSNPYTIYDPNKGMGSPHDHRGDGIDCKVDPELPLSRGAISISPPNLQSQPPQFYLTHLGSDYEKRRLKILQKWIYDAIEKNPPSVLDNTRVMLIPISGGKSQEYLTAKWRQITRQSDLITFFELTDPRLISILNWLNEEHDFNLDLAKSNDVWRYEKRTLGTSSPGGYLQKLYETLQFDMRKQNQEGLLAFTDYQVIHLTDGQLTPVKENIQRALRFYQPCASCANSPETCQKISSTCGNLKQRMNLAWGHESDNDLDKMDFYFGLMQALPFYFGTGSLRLDFVHFNEYRYKDTFPDKKPYYEDLRPLFEKRRARLSHWPANHDEPPFKLVGDATQSTSYKVTDFFVLNLNYRLNAEGKMVLDSDGDGVPDSIEIQMGTDPRNPRTNGFVLDSFLIHPAFRERAEAMAKSSSCDPSLDSDGDSLNECEELLLGTDPFDFDSDGDGIPDSWEWLYGLNPLVPDDTVDSNGDGISNKVAFSVGLPPQPIISRVPESAKSRYEVNFKGKESLYHPLFGDLLLELHEVIIRGMPVHEGLAAHEPSTLYNTRIAVSENAKKNGFIPYEEQLLSVIPGAGVNTITALARLVDVTNPSRVYWRIYKTTIPITNNYKQPQLDLSLLKMIRARDKNE